MSECNCQLCKHPGLKEKLDHTSQWAKVRILQWEDYDRWAGRHEGKEPWWTVIEGLDVLSPAPRPVSVGLEYRPVADVSCCYAPPVIAEGLAV